MADQTYIFAENPAYHTDIRRFQNTDPVNAEEVVNPVLQQIIDNIHSLYLGKATAEDLQAALTSISESMGALDNEMRGYVTGALNEALKKLVKGAPNGVAPLDEDGKVPNEYINAQGGLVAQETPPENITLGWIDTANGGVLKYFDGAAWKSAAAVWG